MKDVPVSDLIIGPGKPLVFITGPCVIESREHALESARLLHDFFTSINTPWIYKSSYDKANRTSNSSFRGPGIALGLSILQEIKEKFNVPILTDIHSPEEAVEAAKVCDILQIPAFLCRQTDLVIAAGETGKTINVKKGQFLAPWDMKAVIDKIVSTGNENIILTDRGTTFGYNNLVSDMRSIPIMQQLGYPVCFDATHSVQLPGGHGTSTNGQREFIPVLARCALAAGANCLFMESHPNPAEAKSDKDSVISIEDLKELIPQLLKLYKAVNG